MNNKIITTILIPDYIDPCDEEILQKYLLENIDRIENEMYDIIFSSIEFWNDSLIQTPPNKKEVNNTVTIIMPDDIAPWHEEDYLLNCLPAIENEIYDVIYSSSDLWGDTRNDEDWKEKLTIMLEKEEEDIMLWEFCKQCELNFAEDFLYYDSN
jgi:hypothetical protein